MLKIRYWWRMTIIVLQFQFMGSEICLPKRKQESPDNRENADLYKSLDMSNTPPPQYLIKVNSIFFLNHNLISLFLCIFLLILFFFFKKQTRTFSYKTEYKTVKYYQFTFPPVQPFSIIYLLIDLSNLLTSSPLHVVNITNSKRN